MFNLEGAVHRDARNISDLGRCSRAWRPLAVGALLAVLAVAGCSGRAAPPVGASGVVSTTGPSSQLAHVASLPSTVEGGKFDAASLTGRPVVLWFWAPWCTICRAEGPTVAKIAAEFSGRVQFVGVAGLGTVSAMRDFVKVTETADITHLADVKGAVWREYGVAVQPAFAFITSNGRADVRIGSLDEKTLRARVAEVAAGVATSTVTAPPGETCTSNADGSLECGSAGPPRATSPATGTTPGR
jgi:thiol-disulfide isomerase/thioredoxin